MQSTDRHFAADKIEATPAVLQPPAHGLVPSLLFTCILQWPLAVIFSSGTFSARNALSVALLLAALVLSFAPGALRRLGNLTILCAAILGSLGSFLAMRHAPISLVLAILFSIWGLTALRTFRLQRRLIAGFSVGLAALLAALLIVEFAWVPAKRASQDKVVETREGRIHIRGLDAYKSLLPSSKLTHKLETKAGDVIFDVQYTVDGDGTRTVAGRPEDGPRWSLFGGSFAFGFGLPNDQTIAAQLQRIRPEVRVFNHGVSWSGTADVYFHMKRQYEAQDPPDWSCYLFIEDHIFRAAAPDWFVFEAGHHDRPCFELRPNLQYVGSAAKRQEKYGLLGQLHCNLLQRSKIYHASVKKAYRRSADDVHRVVALVAAMREMAMRGNRDRFLLVILPEGRSARHDPELFALLKRELQAANVQVLDCREPLKLAWEQPGLSQSDYFLLHDGHPTEKYTRFVAQAISDTVADQPLATGDRLGQSASAAGPAD